MPSLRSSSTQNELERRTTRASANSSKGSNYSHNEDEDLDENMEDEDDKQEEQHDDDLQQENDDQESLQDGAQIDEEEAETRCLCGQADPPDENGLFIQCEKCQVWQHGYCVTITDIVPEKYWCERCKPELHSIIITSEGKKSKYIPVQPKESNQIHPRRKNRARVTKEKENEVDSKVVKKGRKERATYNSREDARYEALIQRVMEESKKDAHLDTDEEKSSSTRSSRGGRRRGRHDSEEDGNDEGTPEDDSKDYSIPEDDEVKKEIKEEESNNIGDEIQISLKETETDKQEENGESEKNQVEKPAKSKSKTPESESYDSNATTSSKPKRPRSSNKSRTKKTSGSTPSKSKIDSTIDFSKPTKPRLPQTRTTLNEMRKRVGAILEFIGRTQIEIANEQNDKNELMKFVEDESSKLAIEKLFENYNGSLELMDGLTRKLLSWEQNFGKYGEK